MKITLTVTVETTTERWDGGPGELRPQVRAYVESLLRHCGAGKEGMWDVHPVRVGGGARPSSQQPRN